MENIRLAFQGIWSHKMRSFLTMLGIIIGIASIITIVSTIKGTNEQIKRNLIGAGKDVVTVQLYQSNHVYDMTWNELPAGVWPIGEENRAELERLNGVEQVSFYLSRSNSYGVAYYKGLEFSGSIYGVDNAYFNVKGYQLTKGRGFVDSDFADHRNVAIIDQTAASSLFGDEDPVGKVLEMKGYAFTVVGVVAQMETFVPNIESYSDYHLYVETSGGCVFIPDAAWPILYRFDEPQSVAVKAESTDAMTRAGKNVADYLTDHQIAPTVSANEETGFSYRSEDLLEQAQQLQEMSSSTNQQLIWIASISLLVGGIGVMNIMLVSVTERTAEIGLKKALGAKRRRILLQFLTEASVLTCLGGLIGVLSGIGMAELLSRVNEIPVALSVPAIVVAVIFSTLIGVIFGLLPAVKAAKLNPIEALRRS